MYRHWEMLIKPALDCIDLTHIVEIGADKGLNTVKLIEYSINRNARLTSIDCFPSTELLALCEAHRDYFTLSDKMSLDALPSITDYEAILIDGDHNWYTVFNELKAIEKVFSESKNFPLILFHDVAWPCDRRDMYYSPDNIPKEFRNNHRKAGVVPGQSDLALESGWRDENIEWAVTYGGVRNGVLTAIEDFIKESMDSYRFSMIDGFDGIGFLATSEMLNRFPKLSAFFDNVDWASAIGKAMQGVELDNVRAQAECVKLLNDTSALYAALEERSEVEKTLYAALEERGEVEKMLYAALKERGEVEKTLYAALEERSEVEKTLYAALEERSEVEKTLYAALEEHGEVEKTLYAALEECSKVEKTLYAALEEHGEVENVLYEEIQKVTDELLDISSQLNIIKNTRLYRASLTISNIFKGKKH